MKYFVLTGIFLFLQTGDYKPVVTVTLPYDQGITDPLGNVYIINKNEIIKYTPEG